jgi:hypothetical protein
MEELTRRQQFYLQMASLPKLGLPHAKEMMALDVEDLNNRVKAQEVQFKSMQKALDLLSPIQDEASLEAARPLLAAMHPQWGQLGPWSDPRTQAFVKYAQQAAIGTKDRMEQQIQRDRNAIDYFGKQADMLKAQTDVARLPIEQQRAATEQARLTEATPQQTAEGEWIMVPKYPGTQPGPSGPGTGGRPGGAGGPGAAVSAPLVNPQTGKPYTSMEALQRRHEWEQGLGAQYQTQSQPMREASLAMGVVRNSLTPPSGEENANDIGLLTNFMKLLNPVSLRDIQEGRTTSFGRFGPVGDRLQRLWDTVATKGGSLTQEDRKFLGDYAERTYSQQSRDFETNILQPTRARARQFPGVVPERDVPDVRTTATQRRLVTEGDVQETIKAMQQRGTPKTRAEVLQDFKDKGYHVLERQ